MNTQIFIFLKVVHKITIRGNANSVNICVGKNGWIDNHVLIVVRFPYVCKYDGIYKKTHLKKFLGGLQWPNKKTWLFGVALSTLRETVFIFFSLVTILVTILRTYPDMYYLYIIYIELCISLLGTL